MADDGERAARMAALTTEHFVMQNAVGAGVNEAQSRATMYIGALSGALVALGFAMQSDGAFVPFVATVLPAVFVMGIFTVLRLVDIAAETMQALIAIAHIRGRYRELGGEAPAWFAGEFGRWPEGRYNASLRLGPFVSFWTTAASMVAFINAVVGAGVVLLLTRHSLGAPLWIAALLGLAVALMLLVAFYFYQQARIAELGEAGARFGSADGQGNNE